MGVTIDLDVFSDLPGARTATVTPAGGSPVSSVVQWRREDLPPADRQAGALAIGGAVNRRQVALVRKDEVPSLPMRSTIVGGPEHQQKTWTVQTVDESHPHYHFAVVT